MPRPLQRATLEAGLKLNINRLARRGFIDPRGYKGSGINWRNNYTGELTASGFMTADMSGTDEGWFNIKIGGGSDQRIVLAARPRHFGGRQWFFMCPYLNRRCMVLWMPPGARYFASRRYWGRRVAYSSQFRDHINRAHDGQARIRSRLCSIGGLDPDQYDFPPKPKWMRWKTYRQAEAKFDCYEETLDIGSLGRVMKLLGMK